MLESCEVIQRNKKFFVFLLFSILIFNTSLVFAQPPFVRLNQTNQTTVFQTTIPFVKLGARNISFASVNQSDFWDNLDTPADIATGDITDDGTYILSADEGNLNVNSSDFWDGYNTSADLYYKILLYWTNITNRPTHLTNFTDNLGDRGYTHLTNFTDDLGHIEGNTSFNETHTNTLYVDITGDTMTGSLILEDNTTFEGDKDIHYGQVEVNNNLTAEADINQGDTSNLLLYERLINGTNIVFDSPQGLPFYFKEVNTEFEKNVTAPYFFGNGSQLTGISAGFENPATEDLNMSGYDIHSINAIMPNKNMNFSFDETNRHIFINNKDVFITPTAPQNAELYIRGGTWQYGGTIFFHENKGGSWNAKIGANANKDHFFLGLRSGEADYTFIIHEYGKVDDRDYDHGAQSNPTLFIHSAVDPNTDNTQWISFAHNQTDGIIDAGTDNIVIRKNLTVEGDNVWVQNITATSYNDWTSADLKTTEQSLESINKISRDGNKINHTSLSDFIRVQIPTYETIIIGEQCNDETICIEYETELNETCLKEENITVCTPLYKKQFKEYKEGRNIGNAVTEIWNGIKRLISWNEEQDIEIQFLKDELCLKDNTYSWCGAKES